MSAYPSPAQGAIPFASNVTALPLPVALERLFQARATGIMTLEARQGRHTVYVRDGYPVAVELPGSFELLGKVLVEMKILDDVTYQSTLEAPPPAGMRYGEMLLGRGLVTEDQLRQALKAQVRRKLHRLYFLTDATITFAAQEHHEGLQRNESLRVHPWRANYHGVRSAWNADRLRQALGTLAGRPLHTGLSADDLARFGLGVEDGRVGSLLRADPRTLDALSADSGLPVQPVSALVYAIYVAAGLDDGAAPAPTPSTKPAAASAPSATAGSPTSSSSPSSAAANVPPLSQTALELVQVVSARTATIEKDDLFTVLGVARTATTDQIKLAYLESAKRFHPDRLAAMGLERLRGDLEKIFRRVSEAQATLLDDTRRAQYLAQLEKPHSAEDSAAHSKAVAILQAEMAFRRGQHLLKKNDLAGALRDFEAALRDHPEEGEYIVHVAWTLYCSQKLALAEAKSEVQRGLRLAPKCAAAHYFLGMFQKEEGADDAALSSFRKAATLDTRQFDAEQEIRVLETRRAKHGEKRGLFDRFRRPGK